MIALFSLMNDSLKLILVASRLSILLNEAAAMNSKPRFYQTRSPLLDLQTQIFYRFNDILKGNSKTPQGTQTSRPQDLVFATFSELELLYKTDFKTSFKPFSV